MSKVIHFNNTADRLAFLRGKHTEIKPKEVEVRAKSEKKDVQKADKAVKDEESEKKPKKTKKKAKKEETE